MDKKNPAEAPTESETANTAADGETITKDTKGVTLTLASPIPLGNSTVAELHIRRPTAGDMRGLSMNAILLGSTDEYLKLLPRLISPAISEEQLVEHINVYDLVQASDRAYSFFAGK